MTGWFTTAFVEDGTFRFKSINYPQYLYTIFGHTIVELLYDLDITGLMQVVYIVMVNPGNQMDCNLFRVWYLRGTDHEREREIGIERFR